MTAVASSGSGALDNVALDDVALVNAVLGNAAVLLEVPVSGATVLSGPVLAISGFPTPGLAETGVGEAGVAVDPATAGATVVPEAEDACVLAAGVAVRGADEFAAELVAESGVVSAPSGAAVDTGAGGVGCAGAGCAEGLAAPEC